MDDNLDNSDIEPESPHLKQTSEYSDAPTSKAKKKKKKKTTNTIKIVLNVADTVYPVVRYVGKKMLKWKLAYDRDNWNWDVYWTDGAVQAETLGKMQPYQKINHFPGMYSLARKNHLGRNLMRMSKQFPDCYKFFPKTWLLPAELSDFRAQFVKGKSRTFILKPEASCQGRGIFLTRDPDCVQAHDHYVAQRYLTKPYLIDGLKFDLRIYVLLAGCDPLRIYIYKEGLARFATEEYEAPNRGNMDNVCMHLTNYAINKDNENFVFNEDENDMSIGHKRSLTSVFELLKERGEDVDKLWRTIKKMMIKTFCAVQPILSHHYKSCQPDNHINNMCFEVLGMDVILNNKLKPYLLEVNHTPSFTTDTPLDAHIKRNLICDALKLMNVSVKNRNDIINERKEIMQQRVLTGKKTKLTSEAKQDLINQLQKQRDEWEDAHLGNFEKVYPLPNLDEDYDAFLEYARKLYEEQTGANIRRNTKKGNSIAPQQQGPITNNSQISSHTQVKNSKSQDLEKIYSNKPPTKKQKFILLPRVSETQQQQQQIQKPAVYPLRQQNSQELSLHSNSNENQTNDNTESTSPNRLMQRSESRGKSFKVHSRQGQQQNEQEKYTVFLKQKEVRPRFAQNQILYNDLLKGEGKVKQIGNMDYVQKYLTDQLSASKTNQIYRVIQHQPQTNIPQAQGNYLTPKLFQLQGVSQQPKQMKKFI